MAGKYSLVDAMTGMPSPPRKEARKLDPNIARWFKPSKEMSEGATLEDIKAEFPFGDRDAMSVGWNLGGSAEEP